jgi:hypothetical protein
MTNEYLRSFVIGSSFLVFIPYFYIVYNFKKKYFNFDYETYTFIAPPVLGLINIISLFIAKQFNISNRLRYFLTSIIAPTIVLMFVMYFKVYNYSKQDWISHSIKLYLLYIFVFNIIVFNVDKYI